METSDLELFATVRSALAQWETEPGFGPTSSVTGTGAIEAFELAFADFCGSRFALGISSGTLALRTALAAVGVGQRTRVLVPALDWPAAAAAALSLGALPVPVDVSPGSFLLDPRAVADRIDPSVAAVVVTHVGGVPADVEALRSICTRVSVPLVEDCCQALGARCSSGAVGTIGDVGVFSIGPGKLIDAGEGGALITNSAEIYARAVSCSQHPVRQLRSGSEANDLVLAARLHPVSAIVGVSVLRRIDAMLAARRRTARLLLDRAAGIPGVAAFTEGPDVRFSWASVPAVVGKSAHCVLERRGLGAQPLGVHDIAGTLGVSASVPNAREAISRVFRLYERTGGADPSRAA